MAAFEQLPWLTSADQFLQAMTAGSRRGLEQSRINQDQVQMPRGGGFARVIGPDVFDQARADALRTSTAQEQSKEYAKNAAWNSFQDLVRRGASEEEAWSQSGLGQFGVPQPKNTEKPIIRGGPGTGMVQFKNGKWETVLDKPEQTVRVSIPVYQSGNDPAIAEALGEKPIMISTDMPWNQYTNSPFFKPLNGANSNAINSNTITTPSGANVTIIPE